MVDLVQQSINAGGQFPRGDGQASDLSRHNAEALPRLPCSRRLDGGVE
ncbi:hypothetical protein SDC9_173027 [bioreactor metagenome]|uniref:Uncharacterized protein n=1 Tax=bioreactor metagenome TaxID=1076179 RepID=A0A645GFZ2_9ZZZZ